MKTIRSTTTISPLTLAKILVPVITLISAPFFVSAETLNRQLQVGSRGTDVSALQSFLSTDPTIYPQASVTGYYGFLTKSAVSNFQSRNGIDPVGRVGPATLPVLNYQIANGMSGGLDTSAPIITSLNLGVTRSNASINWTSNDSARGKVFYSTSAIQISNGYEVTGIGGVEPTFSGTLAQTDTALHTSHSVNITGLTPNTNYFYVVEVLDSANNVSINLPASFHTGD